MTQATTICWYCGKDNDAVAPAYGSPEPRSPKNGDYSVCWHCLNVSIFTGLKNSVRRPTEAEQLRILFDGTIQEIREHILELKQRPK